MGPAAEAAAGADSLLPGRAATRAAAAPRGEVGTHVAFSRSESFPAVSLPRASARPRWPLQTADNAQSFPSMAILPPSSQQFPPKPQASPGFPWQHPGQKGLLKPRAPFIPARGLLREMGSILLRGGSGAGESGLSSATPGALARPLPASPAGSRIHDMLSPCCPAGRRQPETSHGCPLPPL